MAYRRALAEMAPPQEEMLAGGDVPTEAGGYTAMRTLLAVSRHHGPSLPPTT